MSAELLDDLGLEGEPRPWSLPDGVDDRFVPAGLLLGQGQNPLEVVVAITPERPPAGAIRTLWEKRRGKRASPVFCVVAYRQSGTMRAAACGPGGEDPRVVFGLDLGQVGRICAAALAEPDRHAAARLVAETLPEDDADLPGLRNAGMFATHELRSGVAERADWEAARRAGEPLLLSHGRDLVERLGFSIERRDTTTSVLRADGAARAVAVFLQESESPEGAEQRYGGVSPAAHALAAADREALPYAVLTRGRQIRLYAAGKDVGVGRKGRAETFVELNLAVLPTAAAGYLPLIFGADALRAGGSFEDVLERSRDFATGLGERLRDRVYEDAVPRLAAAVAAHRDRGVEADLDFLYEQAMVILFRLLFIAYAEDKDLLPYRASEEYGRRALKTTARELADRLREGREEFDPAATDLWSGARQLFRAIERGNSDWQVPAYGGSLFSSDQEVSRAGATIDGLELTNDEFGPALAALLVDRTVDGSRGPVDFRSLSVREFGTIYEGLLESSLAAAAEDLTIGRDDAYVPAGDGDEVVVAAGEIYLHDRSGARKATGSYFTKPFAVEHLLDHALEPALDAHLERLAALMDAGDEAGAGNAFFDFRCADIAMGSAHFLVAAVDRIEARLSSFLVERPVPAVTAELERLRKAALDHLGDLGDSTEIDPSSLLRRQVARRCIYGVDRNLIAVELARLGIWIHTFVPGLPLSFLDRTLVWGDSLTGVGTLDEAVEQLDPGAGSEASGQSLYRPLVESLIERTAAALARLGRVSDADAAEVAAAREALAEAEAEAQPARDLLDLIVAIRLGEAAPIEHLDESAIAAHPDLAVARELAAELRCLHFPLVFAEVFLRDRPGFDCVLGNPPWDKVRFEAQAFWVTREPGLNALPVGEREAAIEQLRRERPTDSALEDAERSSRERYQDYVGEAFERQGVGHFDYAKLFVERAVSLLTEEEGCLGFVLPRQMLVLGGWSGLRDLLLDGARLRALQTQNRGGWLFEDVHHSYMVVLLSRIPLAASEDDEVGADVWPAITSVAELQSVSVEDTVALNLEELASISDTLVIPWFDSPDATGVFDVMRGRPRLSANDGWVTGVHDARWDFRGSGPDRRFASNDESPGCWRVLMTRHVHAFGIDEEIPFRRYVAEPQALAAVGRGVAVDEAGDPILGTAHPVICLRHPSRNDDARTMIAAALPPRGLIHNKGYVHAVAHRDGTTTEDLLALMAYLNSYICDWWVRRVVDRHVTAPVVNNIPLPNWTDEQRAFAARRAIELLARNGHVELAGSRALRRDQAITRLDDEELLADIEMTVADGFELNADSVAAVLDDFSDRGCPAARRDLILSRVG